jgi:hypothetical protein
MLSALTLGAASLSALVGMSVGMPVAMSLLAPTRAAKAA